jgi:hypothetical protein
MHFRRSDEFLIRFWCADLGSLQTMQNRFQVIIADFQQRAPDPREPLRIPLFSAYPALEDRLDHAGAAVASTCVGKAILQPPEMPPQDWGQIPGRLHSQKERNEGFVPRMFVQLVEVVTGGIGPEVLQDAEMPGACKADIPLL